MTPSKVSDRSGIQAAIVQTFESSCGSYVWIRERGGRPFVAWVSAAGPSVAHVRAWGSPHVKPLRYSRVKHLERIPGEPLAGEV